MSAYGGRSSALEIVTPFKREQVRWALSTYRKNKKIGVPSLLNEIIAEVGDDVIDQLTAQDIYNFLDHGKDARAFKVRILHKFLEAVDSDYVEASSEDAHLHKTADFLSGFGNDFNSQHSFPQFEKELLETLAGATFCSFMPDGEFDPNLVREAQAEHIALLVNFISFAYPGGGDHLSVHTFTVSIPNEELDLDSRFNPGKKSGHPLRQLNPRQFDFAMDYLADFDLEGVDLPIEYKRSGMIVGGLSHISDNGSPQHLMMLRGVEPGVLFRHLSMTTDQASDGGPAIKMTQSTGTLEMNPFDIRTGEIYKTSEERTGATWNAWRSFGASAEYYPINNNRLQDFVAKFHWYSAK